MIFHSCKVLISAFLALLLMGCATGSGTAIITGTKRAPLDPSEVKLYLEAPAIFEVIGKVDASSDAGWTEQESQDYAIQELKNQAAKLGANGVILETTGNDTYGLTMGGGYGSGYVYTVPVTAKTVSGKAIFVSE